MSEKELVVIVGRRYHARCDYCGATEGVEWVTGGSRNNQKIYCSPDCRDAAGLWMALCFTIFVSILFGWIWVTVPTPIPLALILVTPIFIGVPLVMLVRGIQARQRVSRASRFARY